MQSPIKLTDDLLIRPSLIFNNVDAKPDTKFDGYSVREYCAVDSDFVLFDNQRYDFVDLHFHTPAEHHIIDKVHPMEIHIVHQNKKQEMLVFGIMVREGSSRPCVDPLIQNLVEQGFEHSNCKGLCDQSHVNVRDFIPSLSPTCYHYTGSLTISPYTEGVKWMVLQESIEFSRSQIEFFAKIMGNNARALQCTI